MGGRIGLARAAAAPVAVIGLLTTCEYIFNLNLHIDEVLFQSSRVAPAIEPRMAPNAAACFSALAASLLLAAQKTGPLRNTAQAVTAALVGALGLVGFIGYVA
jgi:hypothetical protein